MSNKKSSLSVRINSELKQRLVQEAQALEMPLTEYVEYILNGQKESEALPLAKFNDNTELLIEINKTANSVLSQNNEILKRLSTETTTQVIESSEPGLQLNEVIERKLSDLLDEMQMEDIKYLKDGEELYAEPKNTQDVLEVIVHNYHSLILI